MTEGTSLSRQKTMRAGTLGHQEEKYTVNKNMGEYNRLSFLSCVFLNFFCVGSKNYAI